MGHDSQVPREELENRNSTALSKQPKTSQDVVLDWLRLYAAMPYMRGEHEITAEVILFYSDALKDLRNPLALHKAWDSCRARIRFLPQVPDLLEAYGVAVEKLQAQENQKRERLELCGDCRGTGWKLVDNQGKPVDWNARPEGGRFAVSCGCRGKASA